MTKTYATLALTAIVTASCSLPIEEEREQEAFEQVMSEREILGFGEGPWRGGVFDRRSLASANRGTASTAQASAAQPPLIANNGDTNEVIVMLERDEAALRRAVGAHLPFTAGKRPEDALVEAVRGLEPRVSKRFFNPRSIRYLLAQQRPSESRRQEMLAGSPEDRLHRYVVLEFNSIEDARHAAASLAKTAGVEYASLGQVLSFSAVPNDPYIPIKPTAAHYQWGMHAMAFLEAWDLTRGNAWIGAADTGISTHEDLQNVRPHLSFEVDQPPDSYRAHGPHVSGIMAAVQNNAAGVSGGCPSCSVLMATLLPSAGTIPEAIRGLVDRGAQVINMSFGGNELTCASAGMQPTCDAIAYAQSRDVLLVAAAGNFNDEGPDFPANQPTVLAVGGVQNSNPAQPSQWQSWFYDVFNGSTAAGMEGVVAPAKSVVSTLPPSVQYNSDPWVKCGDAVGFDESGTPGDGYGSCTGTSMAAPHITALGGMIRSINPRLPAENVKSIIRQNASHAAMRNNQVGYGLPNAFGSVSRAISETPNRLTPLFAFYSAGRLDYFYTTVPQMASAAINGTLQPGVGASPPGYSTVGGGITGYSNFPGIPSIPGKIPGAQIWIFTTPTTPQSQSPLAPLYRLSWKCGDAGSSPACANTPSHTDFVYTADPSGVAAYTAVGYQLDGIEGYIYPKTIPQPLGTVRLMRKYNPVRDDHAIFPESELANMQAQGYTLDSGSDWLGYVHPNLNGTVPPVLGELAPSDLNGNGTSDIVWQNSVTGHIYVQLMANYAIATSGFVTPAGIALNASWKIVAVNDINADGKADVVLHNEATGQVYGLLMNGLAISLEGLMYTMNNLDYEVVGAGDFNGDGKADLLWRDSTTGDVYLLPLDGLAPGSGGVIYSEPNQSWVIQQVADFGGDKRADILWRNIVTGDVFMHTMNGATIVSGAVIYSEPNQNWKIQTAADFNGDGRADIVWRNVSTGDAYMMLMNGMAILSGTVFHSEPNAAWSIVAGSDYNGDRKADLLWRNTSTGQVYMMQMDGTAVTGGSFIYTEPNQDWKILGP